MAPVLKRFTMAVHGSTSSSGTGGIAFVGSGSGHSVTYFSGTPSLSLGANVTVDVLSGGGSF